MKKKNAYRIGAACVLAAPLSLLQVGQVSAQALESFAVISAQSLTNVGTTLIDGNIAVWPGTSFTGANTVVQTNGIAFLTDAVAQRVQDDLTTLYQVLEGRPTTSDLTGQNLDTLVLTPGVYNFDTTANLAGNGTLRLDAGGDPDAVFIFNIGSSLTIGSNAVVLLENGAQGGNVFYRVGSSATLGTSSDLQGQIVALTSITMTNSATLACGAAYARNGEVTLDTNVINICTVGGDDGVDDFEDVVVDDDATENAQAVAVALSDFVGDGGTIPLGFAILALSMEADELSASLAQISGEGSTGIAPMGFQAMDAFLDTVLTSGRTPPRQASRGGILGGSPTGGGSRTAAGPASGEGPESAADAVPDVPKSSTVYVPPRAPVIVGSPPGNWSTWASGYGSRTVTEGDGPGGFQERTSSTRGVAAGVNFSPSDRTDFGIALSWKTAEFGLGNGFGTGTGDSVFIALRGRTSSDRGYLEGALAFGRSDITTDRTVTIAGTDRFIADTTAESIAAHIEVGYHIGIFTPFAGLRAQTFRTPSYSETTASGASTYALAYEANTAESLRSALGVEMEWSPEIGGRDTTFGLRAAWMHEFATNDPGVRSFIAIPDAPFSVSGTARDRDSLVLAVNASLTNSAGIVFDAALDTEYWDNSYDLGGSLSVSYRW